MEQTLLQKIKFIENQVDSNEKLVQFKSLVEEFKTVSQDTKKIEKLEDKVNYHTQCLENKTQKEAIMQEFEEKLNSQEDLSFADELSYAFRNVGYAGKNVDELLSANFKKLNDLVSDKKEAKFLERKKQLQEKVTLKNKIIADVKALENEKNFKDATNKFNVLFEQWKQIGYTGKDDDSLWNTFKTQRDLFFERRKRFFDSLLAQKKENAKVKVEIIKKVQDVLQSDAFDNDTTAKMKQFDMEWKQVGNSGEEEEALWKQFSELKEVFWSKRRVLAEEKFTQFKTMMEEVIARKNQQLENLNAQLLDLKTRVGAIKDDVRVQKMRGWIIEKETIIAKLNQEIAEIQAKITK